MQLRFLTLAILLSVLTLQFFQAFVDASIEGAKHPKGAALAWNALLSPAIAGVKNTCGHSYALLTEERQVLLRSSLLYLTLFLTARRIINS